MEARAVPCQRPSEAQGRLGRVAKKGRAGQCAAWGSTPLLCPPGPLPCYRLPSGRCVRGPWRQASARILETRGEGTIASDCVPRLRPRALPTLAGALASWTRPVRSGRVAGPGPPWQWVTGLHVPSLSRPEGRHLGPPLRPPTARQPRCPLRGRAGPGAGGRLGPGPVPPHTPTPLPREDSGALGPHRPNLCLLRRARGTGPNAHRPPGGPGSFTAASSYPASTWRPPGSRVPDAPGNPAGGPRHTPDSTASSGRPGPGRSLGPPATRASGPDLAPLSPSSPGRDSARFAGIRKAVPLDGSIAPGMPTCPSPAPNQVLSLRPSPREKNQSTTKNKNMQKKNPNGQWLRKRAPQPGHLEGCLGGVRLEGQHSTLQGPLRAGSSPAAVVTRNQWLLTEASPAADPNLSVATPPAPWVNLRPREGRRHGARHPQPGSERLTLSGAWTRPTKRPA